MVHVACSETMSVLNMVFEVPLILNDGHEIYERLRAGDEVADIVEDLGEKFGSSESAGRLKSVVEGWNPLHLEALGEVVEWALSKLDTADRVHIQWKGDANAEETVTRFELRGHTLLIEFAPAGDASTHCGRCGSGVGLRANVTDKARQGRGAGALTR